MSYNKHTWVDESVEHPRRIKLKDTTSGAGIATYDYERVKGTVVSEDPLNALKLNNMENAIAGVADYIKPSSGTSPSIVIATQDSNSRVLVEIEATISGTITINRNGAGAVPLYTDYALTEQSDELEAGLHELQDRGTAFYLAPRGADEWGGLKFIVEEQNGILFNCDITTDFIYELDLDTKLSVSSISAPGSSPSGIGGTDDRFYLCDNSADNYYELDLYTKLAINTVSSSGTNPTGIGGINTRLYSADQVSDLLYELDLNTLLQISNIGSQNTQPAGIGGVSLRLYHVDANIDLIYELDVDTKLPISSESSVGGAPFGIGGTNDRLYYSDLSPTGIYELDLDTKLPISSEVSPSSSPYGTGGVKNIKKISITKVEFNGTEYELTDDSPFRVSGVQE